MRKNILVVDDSESIRSLVQTVLENADYNVILANNGKDALKKLDEEKVHMVLTDLHMPEMNGMELISAIRQREDYRYVPILFLTTETKSEMKVAAKKAGATGWITKPFDNDKLLRVIKRVVR